MTRPRPPGMQELAREVGRWLGRGRVVATPSRPAYEFTYTEDVEWLPGGSFLLMQWVHRGPQGEGRGITVMGYDGEERSYFSHTFDEAGKVNRFKGRLEGRRLVLDRVNRYERDGKVVLSRYIRETASPTRHLFRTEVSSDGRSWSTIVEGVATKERSKGHARPAAGRPVTTRARAAATRTRRRRPGGLRRA